MAGRFFLRSGLLLLLVLAIGAPVKSFGSQLYQTLPDYLIQRAWQRTLDGTIDARPWPWLASMPVAQIYVPAFDRELVVLHGVSGEVLAYAPGWHDGSRKPGDAGITIIAGHKDRHFDFLHNLEPGQEILVKDRLGQDHSYTVQEMRIVEDSEIRVPIEQGYGTLLLKTSFPVDNWQQTDRLSLVVVAIEMPLLTASDILTNRSGA